MANNKEVQVLVFEERRFYTKRSKSSGRRQPCWKAEASNMMRRNKMREEIWNPRDIFKEVMELGAAGLEHKAQKKLQQQKLKNLGCKPYRPPKTPYKMFMGIKRAQATRKTRERDMSDEIHYTNRKKKRRTNSQRRKKNEGKGNN